MYYLADFSLLDSIKNELVNGNSSSSTTPQLTPGEFFTRTKNKVRDAAIVGSGKYVYKNKLNRRQKKSVDKLVGAVAPKPPTPPTKPSFFNPFFKKTKTAVQNNGAISSR